MKPVLKVPVHGGSFRLYFDGSTPSANDWDVLRHVIEQVSKSAPWMLTVAGITIGCGTADELDRFQRYLAEKLTDGSGAPLSAPKEQPR